MINNRSKSKTIYRQIRLLFKCLVPINQEKPRMLDLAFLQKYRFVSTTKICECSILKWKEEERQLFMVVDIPSIIKAMLVVPHFQMDNHFFVNIFKF